MELTRRSSEAFLINKETLGPPGIVHLGLGNFHRAHQSVYTARAVQQHGGDWGILGVASRSPAVADALAAQGNLYTVLELSQERSAVSVPNIHTGSLVAAAQPQELLDAISAASTKIVSLTVTENGYTYSPKTMHLDVDSVAIQHDLLNAHAPNTPIGQIVRGLQRRARTNGAAVTILSCDNLSHNGQHTERLIREFTQNLPAGEADELLPWLSANVTFPSTMVDRIVPSTTPQTRSAVFGLTALEDLIPVPAESFSMWVVEDQFAAGRPAWESAGVIFSEDVSSYELLKLRLLNGSHSLIAYLGAMSGAETIAEAINRPFIERAVGAALHNDYLPTLSVPSLIDIEVYEAELFQRWRNVKILHRTSQVGTDGSVKLQQRVPDPAIQHLDAGRMPQHLALTFAAYLSCLAPLEGFDPGPFAAEIRDLARPKLQDLASGCVSGRKLARKVFLQSHIFDQRLAAYEDFIHRIGFYIDAIRYHGVETAAAEAYTAGAGGGTVEIHGLSR